MSAMFESGQVVRYMGRYYCVLWCDGQNVRITAGQSPYQCWYQYQPDMWDYNHWVVSVNDVFLVAM